MQEPTQYDYVLRGGDRGAERLRLLAAVKWPTTETLFRMAGLRQGMDCLDVGCGIGAVMVKMAEIVGNTSRIVGIDIDERCVELARQEAIRLGLPLEYRAGTVSDLKETAAFDFVFARFVLTHLREPENALHRMVQAARPGGVVVVEDIEFAGHFCHSTCPAFERYVSLYQQVVRQRGGDPNIGPRLLGMFQDEGLNQIRLELVQPTYHDGQGKRIAQVTMEHIREAVVASGLASEAEIDDVVAGLNSFADDPRTIMSLPRIFQVWGTR